MPKYYDDALDDVPAFERCESFEGGMDAYTRSTLLQPNQYQYGENIIIADNAETGTRPGADKFVAFTFTGKIQGVFYFDTPSFEQLLFANAGKLYTAGSTGTYTEQAGFTLNDGDVDFVAAQGIDKALVVDGVKIGVWNGAAWTSFVEASRAATDPPTGASTVVFCAGRMWAGGFPGTGGAGREDDAVCFSAIGDFGIGAWSLTDKSFRVGMGEGDPLLGLAVLTASVPEQEVLAALKQNSIRIIRVDPTAPDSAGFKATLAPETMPDGLGIVGKRAFAVAGNDLIYVAPDHSFRSLARMAAAAGQYEISPIPVSKPMQPYITRINWDAASTIAVHRYKQLVFFAVPFDTATHPDTTLVWNGRLRAWVGLFTGWTPNSWTTTRFNGVQRLIFGEFGGTVKKWKDFADESDDSTYLDDGADIASKQWFRSFLFGEPLNNKNAYALTGRMGTSNAVVTFTLVGDNAELFSWTKDLRPTGPNLPIDLPFDLTSAQNTPMPKGLRDLPEFNECYVKMESDSGWWRVRNFSMAAFVNTLAMNG